MSWSEKYKRSIDCDNPKGFSQRAHCQGRKKKLKEQFKPFKTVEQIAKKHRLDVSFIQKQLDMGEPIEHEHTKDHKLAKEIALQHLDEIPDYYTRLKKMEASAKKEHKKFKDVKINEEGLRDWYGKSKSKGKKGKPGWVDVVDGDACAREEGETATPKCVSSERRASMSKAERLAAQARKRRQDPNQPQKSGAAKPTYVKTDYTLEGEMDLQEVKDKPGKGSGKKDACYHKVKSRYSVWPSAYASGALVKCRKVGAKNWGTKSEQIEMQRYCPKCKKNETQSECKYGPRFWAMYSTPITLTSNQLKYDIAQVHPANEEKDHEYSMARSQLSTVMSAVKRLKKKMKGEGNIEAWVQSKITKASDYLDAAADYLDSGEHDVEESLTIEDSNGNSFAEVIDVIGPNQMEPIVDEGCWKGYKQLGMKKKGDKLVPNCVKESYSDWRQELSEDWQKVNRQDKTDGLSPAAVKAYRRENPGSKLQTAVTEKKPKGKRAKRRANFCRRMKGMKDKLTSAKTARDPNSRINKALRRWRCN